MPENVITSVFSPELCPHRDEEASETAVDHQGRHMYSRFSRTNTYESNSFILTLNVSSLLAAVVCTKEFSVCTIFKEIRNLIRENPKMSLRSKDVAEAHQSADNDMAL